jgi:hypothetical protein
MVHLLRAVTLAGPGIDIFFVQIGFSLHRPGAVSAVTRKLCTVLRVTAQHNTKRMSGSAHGSAAIGPSFVQSDRPTRPLVGLWRLI